MKTISQNVNSAQWDNKLIKDLAFIRERLRYPFNAKTFYPVLILAGLFPIFIWFAIEVFSANPESRTLWIRLLPVSILVATTVVNVWRYFQTLRFVSIPTDFHSVQNQQILKQFLEAQHLLVFRHPDAPEVFQIASKAIDTIKDEREVLIFIVDDKRILINSHFTYTSKISFYSGKRHYKQMAKMLKEWISDNSVSNSMAVSI